MEIAGKDIIIVGSQSGTVTYDYGNLQQFAVNQYSYLLGTLPELIVLCINPYDNDTYIRRTINFIENSIETKVFALVLFPMNVRQDWQSIYGTKYHMSEEELDQKKKTIETNLEIDTYILDREEDIDQLFERIVSYFSA
jgi:hypothetical protein